MLLKFGILSLEIVSFAALLLLPAVSPSAHTANQSATPASSDCMYEWLRRVGLQPAPATEYQQLFVREEFNELVLRVATLDQLKELGVTKLGHRTLIYNTLPAVPMCENSALCDLISDGEASFRCSCLEGYSGERCQYVTSCGETVCRNGRCSVEDGVVQCTCAPGFTGSHCEHDMCHRGPCLNGGTCSHSTTGYKCSCPLGFEGFHCEQMWKNKTSVEQLAEQVAFLERLHVEEERSRKVLLRAKELMDSSHGPRFMVRRSVIGPPGVIRTAHFSVGHTHYTMFLSDTPAEPQLSGVTVYHRHDNHSLTLVQTLPILSPTSLTVFSIHGNWYLTVISVPSEGSGGPNTRSALYKWTVNGFVFTQELSAPGARDVEFVVAGGIYQFLVFACGKSGRGQVQNSAVYVRLGEVFVFYQSLVTHGGERVSSLITHSHLVFVCVSSSVRSTVFQWNGTHFALFQELNAFRELSPIQIGLYTFLTGVSDYWGVDEGHMSTLYRLDTPQFTAHTHLSTPGAVEMTYMHIDSEHFIAFQQEQSRSSSSHVSLYKLDGAGTVSFQTLPESGSLSTYKSQNGCVMLTVSQAGSTSLPSTVLYSWSSVVPCSSSTDT